MDSWAVKSKLVRKNNVYVEKNVIQDSIFIAI